MAGEMGKVVFPVEQFRGNKISIIKAFRDYIVAAEFNEDNVYEEIRTLEEELRLLEYRLNEMKSTLVHKQKQIQNHRDPYFFSDSVDRIVEEEGISNRARGFLLGCPTGSLKEIKDAVELMIATGDITGFPKMREE